MPNSQCGVELLRLVPRSPLFKKQGSGSAAHILAHWFTVIAPGTIAFMLEETKSKEQAEPAAELQSAAEPQRASWREQGIVLVVMALVLLADQLSKLYVESRLPMNSSWAPFPALESIFRITHVSNTGAAFGLFQSGSVVLAVVAVIVSGVILLYNRHLPASLYWYRLALGMQLGGALGNLLSRIRIGHVTDFLDFGPVPIFNVADASIVVGTILLGFLMIFHPWETAGDHANVVRGERQGEEAEAAEDESLLLHE
jgi:signal peptidase II